MSVDRDRILEHALKHELRRDSAVTPAPALRSLGEGGCLDAETIAAWHDGGLDAAQMSAVESHTSTCSRCQSMLAAFARGTAGAPSTQSSSGTQGTLRWWRWGLAPIVAGAAAATLWMVVPEQQRIAMAPPPAGVAMDSTQSQGKAAATDQAPAAAQTFADAGRKQDADEKLRAGVEPAREDRQQVKDAIALKEEKTIDQAVAITPPPTATVAIGAVAPAPGTAAFATGATGAVALPGARSEPISPSSPPALQKSARLAVGSIDVFTLDANVRWRIIGNRIGRSTDAGSSWAVVREEPSGVIFAGSSPSAAVAWFVGRAGLVLVTTDAGATFRNVNLAVPLDIASVSATDAQSAVVSTVSGQRFRTQDGGRSWSAF